MVFGRDKVVQNKEPNRNVEQCQTDNHQTHNGARTESHFKAAVERVAGRIGRTCRSVGGGLHSEETGQAREETARQEREPNPRVLQPEDRHNAEKHGQHHKDDNHHLVLLFQIGHRALAHVSRNLFHQVGALVLLHHLTEEEVSETQRHHRSRQNNIN